VKLTTTAEIPAARERVFAALVDPETLRQCIPGCEQLVAAGDDVFDATLRIGVAGLKGTYLGRAELRDKQPPAAFSIRFDGKGGSSLVRGVAAIRLSGEGETTRVECDADVQVGGVIAAIGSRLVDATARKLAADFFRRLAEILART